MTLLVRDLKLMRGGRLLLSDLSFDVLRGEALILRGANGVGKTTLLRVLAGLAQPHSGTVRFDTTDARTLDAWSDIAVFGAHADGIKGALSVRDNLAFWAGIYGNDAANAIRIFDLEPFLDRLAGACSAGQRRRLGLARLVLSGRPVWLLDEPTVSLDAPSVEALLKAVKAHLAEGGLAVIASHDPALDLNAQTLNLVSAPRQADEAEDPFLAGAVY